jgi:hypothetical protein
LEKEEKKGTYIKSKELSASLRPKYRNRVG